MMFDPKAMAEKRKVQCTNMRENLRRFYEAGGKIAIGTDLIHSNNFIKDAVIPTIELRHLAEVGLPFQEVIKTGTIYPAELIGTAREEGTIEVGKLANLIAVPGEVDETFKALDNVPFVMHYGTVVKNHL